MEPATLPFRFAARMVAVSRAGALGGRTGALRPGLRARPGGGARGADTPRSERRAAGSGRGARAMSCVGPLRPLRAAVRLRLGLRRAAAGGAGPRAVGTRAEAGAGEQPGPRGCAVRIGCASAFWGDTAASGNAAAICAAPTPLSPSLRASPEGQVAREARR